VSNVSIITPSYLMQSKREFCGCIAQLGKLGFRVMNPEFPKVLPSPREKADQIHRAFADPETDIVLAQRGGYSAMKVLPFLDFDLIGKHPKILAGFSDLTALLNPVYQRTGFATLHAPMLVSLGTPTPFTLASLGNALQGYPEKNLFKGAPVTVYRPGVASGILKGGNLTTLSALIDTDWETVTNGSLLFLEDVDEKLHKIDRYLTQWLLAGKFQGVKGIILGDFRGVRNRRVYDILASQMDLDIPVVYCPYIGHVANMITLPVGAEVELDTGRKRLLIKNTSFPGVQP
jgi:muramoyltetrapeptide carboxypeptidase